MSRKRRKKKAGSASAAETKADAQASLFEEKEAKEKDAPEAEPDEASEPAPADEDARDAEDAAAEDELATLRRERDEYLDLAQRARAELENYRRRVAREREQESARLQGEVIREILTPLDDLDRALKAAGEVQDFNTLYEGLQMVRKSLWKGLESVGLNRIPADPGTAFDPNVHEGMAQVPHPDFAANAIVEEISPGYRLGDRVLRASRVVVSAGPPPAETGSGENGG